MDAIVNTIDRLCGVSGKVEDYRLRAVTGGRDAQGEVTVTVEHNDRSYRGRGASVDIVEAGCRACLEVMNRILRRGSNSGPGQPSTEQATI